MCNFEIGHFMASKRHKCPNLLYLSVYLYSQAARQHLETFVRSKRCQNVCAKVFFREWNLIFRLLTFKYNILKSQKHNQRFSFWTICELWLAIAFWHILLSSLKFPTLIMSSHIPVLFMAMNDSFRILLVLCPLRYVEKVPPGFAKKTSVFLGFKKLWTNKIYVTNFGSLVVFLSGTFQLFKKLLPRLSDALKARFFQFLNWPKDTQT